MVGTPYYLSPEIIEGRPYSFKSDIWSLGVMLYEMCALRPPFEGSSMHYLSLQIVRGRYPPLPSHFSRELKTLVGQMLEMNVSKRINIHQILKQPIISRRIRSFMSGAVFQQEFSHTILHNQNVFAPKKPEPPKLPPPSLQPSVQAAGLVRQKTPPMQAWQKPNVAPSPSNRP